MRPESLLEIKNLTIGLSEEAENKTIVQGLSLSIFPKTIAALVGGSGSGKTTTGLAVLRLLPPVMDITQGEITFQGKDMLNYSIEQMRQLRGKEIAMVFQEPLYAFNPVFRIGQQMEEVLIYHCSLNKQQREQRILDLLDMVGITEPQRVAQSYPHQLSGGMRQRAMIAQAIAAEPQLIIADEPTSNLDVTLQAHIMDLFRKLKERLNLSILLITHDLGVVTHLADDIFVLSEGRVVESGPTQMILAKPQHRFTQELMETFR